MENRRYVTFFKISFMGALLLAAPVFVLAYGVPTHVLLTREIIRFAGVSLDSDQQSSIVKGTVEEDNGTRWMQHFYDPVHNRGLTFGGDQAANPNVAYVGSAPIRVGWQSAKDWAMNTKSQAGTVNLFSSILGNHFSSSDDYSWDRAIYEYAWGDKSRGLESLGHVLHLIEDASVPDHTRNDPHPAFGRQLSERIPFLAKPQILAYLGDHNVTNSSPYESFAVFVPGSVAIADTLKLESKKPIILSSLADYFDNVARYSNKNFFSKDTIFSKEFSEPKIGYYSDGFGYNNLASVEHPIVREIKKFDGSTEYTLIDSQKLILSDYWNLLSKQAVLHGAGVVKFFFDEVEKEKQTKTLYNKNRSWVGKGLDGIKNTAFGAVSIFYGTSVTQDDINYDASQPSISPFVQPSSSISPSILSTSFPSSVPIPSSIQSPNSSPIPQHTAQVNSKPSSNSSSLSPSISESSGSGEGVGSSQSSRVISSVETTPSPSVSVSASSSPTPSSFVSVSASSTPAASSSPSSTPTPSSTPFADTQAPAVSFSVNECSLSLSLSGCLIATTTITLLWSSSDIDLAHYSVTCVANGTACNGFSFASTTATTTIYIAPADMTSYTFTAKAADTSNNESNAQTISVDVWLRPVVINEIAWAGTGGSATTDKDEWVELYNPTSKDISLSGVFLNSLTDSFLKINLSGSIAAHDYYLIERTDNDAVKDIPADITSAFGNGLSNNGEQLAIMIGSTTIDKTPAVGTTCIKWCAGTASSQYLTMERYDPLSSGENKSNWESWQDIARYGTNAESQQIKGTPKHRNSVNYRISLTPTVSSNKTVTKVNNPYVIYGQTTVTSLATLTIEPGVIIKFKDTSSALVASGIILAQGTAVNPIIFTSFADDSYAGDTNQNGASTTPAAGNWGAIRLLKNGSVIDHTVIRYGGGDSQKANITAKNISLDITNSIVERSKYYGIYFDTSTGTISGNTIRNNAQQGTESMGVYIRNGSVSIHDNLFAENYMGLEFDSSSSSNSDVSHNTFTNNIGDAIITYGAYPIFSGNSATGNGINGIHLAGSPPDDYVMHPDIPYVLPGSSAFTIAAGKKVTIMPGVVIKFQSAMVDVVGVLEVNGTAASPVVFTSFHDDDCGIAGGCGNTDNASTTPQAGDWSVMRFESTSGPSRLEYTTIRYGGNGFGVQSGSVQLYGGGSLALSHVTLEKNYGMGVRLENASLLIADSLIQNHKGNQNIGEFYGIYLISSSTPTILNTHFKNNDVHIKSDSTSSYIDGGGNVFE